MALGPYLSNEERRRILQLAREGSRTGAEIAAEVGRSAGSVYGVIRAVGGIGRLDRWAPSPARLGADDRDEIALGLARGESMRSIARRLGRAASTITREVARNGGRSQYRPATAHRAAARRAQRPKPVKLVVNPRLAAQVIEWLEALWSPQQIAGRLRRRHPQDPTMWVSHETIYQSIYVQGRGALRRELARCLRTGRTLRRPVARMERRGSIPNAITISERPAEAADRAVPGHWEGDLIMGAGNHSAIGTLVERATRYCVLLHLPHNHTADEVNAALTASVKALPDHLVRSLTWDRGQEMSRHASFTVATDVEVYFCDPRSPWQRGTNENTNGLLRQWFPKGTDLSVHTAADLERVAASLNNRPRQTLGWMKPSEKFAELVAMTG